MHKRTPLRTFRRTTTKLLRTCQVHFPGLLDAKFAAMRYYRNALRSPFEYDFNALPLFPAADGDFLDVGANRGQSTDAILMRRPEATVHLFEPNALLFEKLVRMFGGKDRLHLHPVGLADQETTADLNVPVYNGWMFDGLGSFNQAEAQEWLRHRMYFYHDEKLVVRRLTCRIVTLDSLGVRPCFIKIDIQGYELKALKGGERTLVAHEPVLLIESPDDETVEYLGGLGYEFFAFVGGKFIERAIGAPNTFFMTPARSRPLERHITRRTGAVLRF